MQRLLDDCRRQGYITTLAGRRRGFPDITSPNPTLRAAAERQAINSMVQGSGADILRRGLLAIKEKLPAETARPVRRGPQNLPAACVQQAHDCADVRARG